mgnify:CR=1 FL=1
MRPLALALALPLVGCTAVTDSPFDLLVTNGGTETVYVQAGESSGVLVGISEQIDGEWVRLATSLSGLCAPRCSDPPGFGAIACADAAAEFLIPHALLPGDSASRSYDGELWYLAPRGCARKAPGVGPFRGNVCHDRVALDQNGEEIDEPAASGPVGSFDEEVFLPAPVCEEIEFSFEDGVGEIVIEG